MSRGDVLARLVGLRLIADADAFLFLAPRLVLDAFLFLVVSSSSSKNFI